MKYHCLKQMPLSYGKKFNQHIYNESKWKPCADSQQAHGNRHFIRKAELGIECGRYRFHNRCVAIKLNRLPKVKKTGMHEFQYDLEFEGIQYDLFRVTYDVTIDTTTNELQDVQGDTLTGDLHRFMTVLVANANRVFPGKWVLGVCPETAGDKTLTFGESDNCLSVLQNLCGESNLQSTFMKRSVRHCHIHSNMAGGVVCMS